MSFTAGTGLFGNYDLSAQTGGMPVAHRTLSHEDYVDESTTTHQSQSHSHSHRPSHPEIPTSLNELPQTPDNDAATLTTEKGTPGPSENTSKNANLNEKGTGTDSESEDDERNAEAQRSSLVQHLARQYTNKSHASGVTGANPFAEHSNNPDSPLNPHGEKFSARAWARNVFELMSNEGHDLRTSGIAFQNLNVFGFGAGTDYQKDVANVWLGLANTARSLLGGSQQKRIDILRDFDGVVNSGEMLVILGPPGSGCSTFLKTIAGEMNGIYVEDDSYFNYQGKCDSDCFASCVGTSRNAFPMSKRPQVTNSYVSQVCPQRRCTRTTEARPSTLLKSMFTFPC